MSETVGALDVHLHPLVLVNISDHIVRFQFSGRTERILGAVIGAQEGRRVDIHNSFELVAEADGLELEFFQQRLAQYMEVFPKYEFLGWYSSGQEPHGSDKALRKKIQEVTSNENPLLLLMNPTVLAAEMSGSEELPVKVYDAVTHIAGNEVAIQWNEMKYVIDTLEAERIAVNHVAKSATQATSGHSSDFTQHASSLTNSVQMLNHRVRDLLEYAKAVKEGNVQKNHQVLRQLLSICEALKSSHPDMLHKQFYSEFNDAGLVVLLASLTKSCASISDLLDKFQLAHDKKHRQRHHYPFG